LKTKKQYQLYEFGFDSFFQFLKFIWKINNQAFKDLKIVKVKRILK